MPTVTLQDILAKLDAAEQATLEATDVERVHDDSDNDIMAYDDIIVRCQQIERNAQRIKFTAERRYKTLNSHPASEREMTTFIVKQIEKEGHTVKKAVDLSDGSKSTALRRAEGKCELCGHEWRLSVHHIIPRADGGLTYPDNLIVLCNQCHDEVEDCGYHSRAEVLRHSPSRVVDIKPKREDHNGLPDLKPSEKAAITRQENLLREAQIDREVSEWGEPYDALFAKCVVYVPLGVEPPRDPDWYVIVYGAGRHAAAHGKRS